jgi:branched-chain amino acid transport system substrate-binding protein
MHFERLFRHHKIQLLFLLVLLGLQGCQKKGNLGVPEQEVIRIGEIGTLTGSEASFGVSTHRGVELAVHQINASGGIQGKKIELLTLDDQGKAEETTAAATKLISQFHVVALVGGHPSSRGLAVSPIAQKYKVPYVHSGSTHPQVTEVGDYIFRVCFIDPFQGQVMAKFASNGLNLKRVAILRDMKSDYSIGLTEFFKKTFLQNGGEILIEQNYGSGDIDFKSQLTAIRSKLPEAIFVPGYYTEAALIARQARELGINVPLLGGDGWDSPKFLEIGGSAVNGTYYSTHYSSGNQDPKIQSFVSNFRKTYGEAPDGLAALAYDGVMVLAESIKRTPQLSSKDIQLALKDVKNFEGVTGKITLDQNRNPIKSAVILQIDNGKIKYNSSVSP